VTWTCPRQISGTTGQIFMKLVELLIYVSSWS
jgi:hypothetical protein